MIEFVLPLVVTAALLFVVGKIVAGIEVRDARAALLGALVLGIANAIVRSVLVMRTRSPSSRLACFSSWGTP